METQTFYSGHRERVRARARVGSDSSSMETGIADSPQGTAMVRVNAEPKEPRGVTRIVAADLYLDSEVLSPALVRALALLTAALKLTAESLQFLGEDPMAADLNVQSLRPLLRKLFMYRQVGDGFATVVDALISAFDNNHGMPLDEARLVVVQNSLLKLRDEPFLPFEAAVHVVEDVERAGFSTEPPGFEHLADWLTV